MVKYLLDTCVLSELNRPEASPGVSAFVARTKDDQWISALSFGELVRGAHMLPTGRRHTALLEWIGAMEREFESRIVPLDVDTARIWGEISGDLRRRGIQLAFADGLIAATAIQHGMHVVTRNVKDFEPTGVMIVNPWENDQV